MIIVGIVMRNHTVDFPEIHEEEKISVGLPWCNYGACVLGEWQYCDDSILVH